MAVVLHRRAVRKLTKRLIVTGDDFGLSLPVNEAIEQAHRTGILSTASLMIAAPQTEDAVRRARALASLRVGLHVVVVDGRPVLPPEQIPDLLDGTGHFPTQLARAGINFFFRPKVRRQLEAEIRAQFEGFRATRLALDHVNAHNHMHVHPTVLGTILKIGQDYGVRAVRVPREPFLPSWRAARRDFGVRFWNEASIAPWLGLMKMRLRRARIARNDFVFGMNDTGRMTSERVLRLLQNLPPGVSEMYFHPATRKWAAMTPAMRSYAYEEELAALTSPAIMDALRAHGIALTTFSDVAAANA